MKSGELLGEHCCTIHVDVLLRLCFLCVDASFDLAAYERCILQNLQLVQNLCDIVCWLYYSQALVKPQNGLCTPSESKHA